MNNLVQEQEALISMMLCNQIIKLFAWIESFQYNKLINILSLRLINKFTELPSKVSKSSHKVICFFATIAVRSAVQMGHHTTFG